MPPGAWIAVAAYMGAIYLVSGLSLEPPPFGQKFHLDWFVHVVEYGVLGLLLARAFYQSWRTAGARLWFAALAVGTLYAASDEWHQRSVPSRDASVYDLCADAAGVAIGASFWMSRHKKIHGNQN